MKPKGSADHWRLRVGDWRVVMEYRAGPIGYVVSVVHRSRAYR